MSFLLGVRARACGVIAATLGWLGLASDTQGWLNSLHLLYLATFLLATTDCDRALAIAPSAHARAHDEAPDSGLWLMRALLVSIYASTAIAKVNRSWLSGDTLELFIGDGSLQGRVFDWLHAHRLARVGVAWTAMGVESGLGPALLVRRTRAAAVVVALAFHGVVEVLVHPDVFGWTCAVLVGGFVGVGPRGAGATRIVGRAA